LNFSEIAYRAIIHHRNIFIELYTAKLWSDAPWGASIGWHS